jgi:Glu-tRNA(Gln) amidotransferase subunit E-like FAD-binding protein
MITLDGVLSFLDLVIRNYGFSEELLPKPFDSGLLELEFRTAIDELNKIKLIDPQNKYQLIMGIMMKRLRGRIEGKKVADFVKTRNY